MFGPTLDYAHRILATDVLLGERYAPDPEEPAAIASPANQPAFSAWRAENDVLDPPKRNAMTGNAIPDLSREPLPFPSKRAHTPQGLANVETGGVLPLGYAAIRGYGQAHPTVNTLGFAKAEVAEAHPDGRLFSLRPVKVSEAKFVDKKGEKLSILYPATLAWNGVKCIAAATLDLNSKGAE